MFTKTLTYLIITIVFLTYIIYDTQNHLPDGLLHIYVLDIGTGDATLIQTPQGKYILIDAGPDSYVLQSQLQNILPWHRKYLDFLFITHPHADHYYGFFDLENTYKPKGVGITNGLYKGPYPEWIKTMNEIHSCKYARSCVSTGGGITFLNHDNDFIFENKLNFNTLYPISDKYSKDYKNINNSSLVQKLSYKNFSMLFTGDIEEDGLDLLTKLYKENLKSTILKASHHGSKNGITDDFLKYTDPSLFTISTGENNTHGHPSPETINKLDELNIPYLITASEGTIEIITDGNEYQICKLKNKIKNCQEKISLEL